MRVTKRRPCENPLTTDTEGLCSLTGSGRYTAVQIGEAAEAKIKIGKRILWNVSKVKAYLDSISM